MEIVMYFLYHCKVDIQSIFRLYAYVYYQFHPWKKIIQTPKKKNKCCEDELPEATPDDQPEVTVEEERRSSKETEAGPLEDTATEMEEDGIEEEVLFKHGMV